MSNTSLKSSTLFLSKRPISHLTGPKTGLKLLKRDRQRIAKEGVVAIICIILENMRYLRLRSLMVGTYK